MNIFQNYYRTLKRKIKTIIPRDYPKNIAVGDANEQTIEFIKTIDVKNIAEIGIYHGKTTQEFAKYLNGSGQLHIFDFQDKVDNVKDIINKRGYTNITTHGNSHKLLDSYNWSLMRFIQSNNDYLFDYIFIDGAHTWNVDALTFYLSDKILKVGGYLDFDDYTWSLATSPSLNPEVFPLTEKLYTEDQIDEQHVKLIVELLVRSSGKYEEVIQNKIFKKIS